MRASAWLCLAAGAWGTQVSSNSTSVHPVNVPTETEEGLLQSDTTTDSTVDTDTVTDKTVKKRPRHSAHVIRRQHAQHQAWIRKLVRQHNAWFGRSTRTYRSQTAAARRKHAKDVANAKRQYHRTLRTLRIRRDRRLKKLANGYRARNRRYQGRWKRRFSRSLARRKRAGRFVLLRSAVAIRRNKKIGTIRTSRNYQLTFNIRPTGAPAHWRSVLHFTTGGNHGRKGTRIPGIWFFSRTTRLHIRSGRAGNHNDGCDPAQQLARHRTTRVKVRVAGGQMKVWYNGRLVCRSNNYRSPTYDSRPAKVYVGDPWYHNGQGTVSKLVYQKLR